MGVAPPASPARPLRLVRVDETEAYDRMLREDLERDLAREYPDPAERKKAIDEILRRDEPEEGARAPFAPGESETHPADPNAPPPEDEPGATGQGTASRPGRRRSSPAWRGTMFFVERGSVGLRVLAVRAGAALVRGPLPPLPVRSVVPGRCPRDVHQSKRLAPSLAPGRVREAASGNRALQALCGPSPMSPTPRPGRTTDEGARPRVVGVSGGRPARRHLATQVRRLPSDMFLIGTADELGSVGRSLRGLLPRYEEAIQILDDALAKVEAARTVAGALPGRSAPRRFLLQMSAFHFEAIARAWGHRGVVQRFDRKGDQFVDDDAPGDPPLGLPRGVRRTHAVQAGGDALPESALPRVDADGVGRPAGRWEPGASVPGHPGNVLRIPPGIPLPCEARPRGGAETHGPA